MNLLLFSVGLTIFAHFFFSVARNDLVNCKHKDCAVSMCDQNTKYFVFLCYSHLQIAMLYKKSQINVKYLSPSLSWSLLCFHQYLHYLIWCIYNTRATIIQTKKKHVVKCSKNGISSIKLIMPECVDNILN